MILFCAVLTYFAYTQGFFILQTKEPSPSISSLRLFGTLCVFLGTPLVFSFFLFPQNNPLFYQLLVHLAMLGLLYIGLPKQLFFFPLPLWGYFFFFIWMLITQNALVSFFTELLAFFNIESYIPQHIVQESQNNLMNGKIFVTFLLVTILAPLLEELIFRRTLQQWLKKWLSPLSSILCTSAVFALCHFELHLGLSNLTLFLALFISSFFFGLIYEKTLLLGSSFFLHALYNCTTLFLLD